jgi:zinc/manganese transport system substrate-binding protein
MQTNLKILLLGTLITVLPPSFGSVLAQDKAKAVASFSILADFVQKVGGDRVEVTTLVGPDGDAHVYEPKPDDTKAMAASKLVFINGLAFEGWMDRLVESSGYKGPLVKASDGIEAEKMQDDHAHSEEKQEHDHDREHGAFDPHAWQSAANAQVYVRNIADALCKAEEADCPLFRANAEAYSKELGALHEEILAAVAKVPEGRRTVITSHDAFGYFSHAYGIRFIAPEGVSTESEASAKDVARLIRQIREDKASALFVENVSDPRLIEQISRETGLKVGGALYSDALSGKGGPAATYIDMMRHNTRLLTEAMAGS